MTTVKQVMAELKKKGDPRRVKAYEPHGAPENIYGVSVADMKVIAKKIKGQQDLACELYDTGNGDAMYLAGIVADGTKMTKKQLDSWAKQANWQMISEYSVPGVAHESEHARELALNWIDSKKEGVASAGWNTLSGIVTVTPDKELDIEEIKRLLKRIENEIDSVPNRVRYTMNGFVIAVGAYVSPLNKLAKATAKRLGKVEVDMHGTSCKVPLALEYIEKIEKLGKAGKKRKTIKC
ncbi:MAG: DNA alkylation repair protein [Acidobacteria bacterium]|nr:MAG: DNA alkylation repair protein [Acidobacteriota bacterium]REJ98051.1 MAG: DNA alkylation repair protein [Acidobacteriota bacterium]REK16794.1 MAG: DNA alkylation repair protein [Acidobacteriota bacterium]REK42705.1 MAG: DNA alkylation repair protein [Acidobacteriota bacterium]